MQVGQLQTCFSLAHSTQCHTFRLLNDVSTDFTMQMGMGRVYFPPQLLETETFQKTIV